MKAELGFPQWAATAGVLLALGMLSGCSTASVGANKQFERAPVREAGPPSQPAGDAAPGAQAPAAGAWQPGSAKIRAIRGGEVDWAVPGQAWQPAGINRSLRSGDWLRTQPKATADLFLAMNGPVLRLLPGTLLHFERLAFARIDDDVCRIETVLGLERGRLLAVVREQAPGSVYEIRTPKARYRARRRAAAPGSGQAQASLMDVSAEGRVVVVAGKVECAQAQRTLEIKSGEAFDPALDAVRPATPQELQDGQAYLAVTRTALGVRPGPGPGRGFARAAVGAP